VGSIPIARSRKPVDAVGLTDFPALDRPEKHSVLDAVGRVAPPLREFWTQPTSCPFSNCELKAIREVIDERIEHLSKLAQQGTKICVE
jgi:hypothetical protein